MSLGKTRAPDKLASRGRLFFACLVVVSTVMPMAGCQRSKTLGEPTATVSPSPTVDVPLAEYGLPKHFFDYSADDGYCDSQIICYRFVVWLDIQHVAVGFSTSPRKRVTSSEQVKGNARILLFTSDGQPKAKRDIPYLADGNGELVADGEAQPGPDGTLLFRIQSVNLDQDGRKESKSAVLLLDAQLNDVNKVEGLLEQTTFVNRTMIFQQGFASNGSRNYDFVGSQGPIPIKSHAMDWPVGAMDRKFGDNGAAYMACTQELAPGQYKQSPIIFSGANRRCAMQYEGFGGDKWAAPLRQNEVGQILGALSDGSVAAEVRGNDGSERVVIWQRDGQERNLPWLPNGFVGEVVTPTQDMSRYGALAVRANKKCLQSLNACERHWMVFDAKKASPIVDRLFPKTGSVALSPDGMKYASFEDGKLRIVSLSK